MRRSCLHMYAHLVWATYDRRPIITPALEQAIYDCIRQKCKELGCDALAIGGIEDHVHLLIRQSATISVAHLIKHVKGSSSHLAANVLAPTVGFRWQGRYSGYSIAETQVDKVPGYVLNQKEHHRAGRLWPVLERCEEEDETAD